MIGRLRRLALYARPSSSMKRMGESVCRFSLGLSDPRGASAPPITVTFGETRFNASYVRARRPSYARGEVGLPRRSNCGSQNLLRFGSLPMMKSRMPGAPRAMLAAYSANCACRVRVRGVVLLPGW